MKPRKLLHPVANRFLLFSLLLTVLAACNGPLPVDPVNSRITDAEHTAEKFPIDHGAVENPTTDCTPCHGGLPSFSQFKCTSCHEHEQAATDSLHTLVAEYRYDSTQCLSCHPQGTAMGREEHTEYFPIKTGAVHSGESCEGCHTRIQTLGYADANAYKDFSCIDCHTHNQPDTDTAHASVTGYKYESKSCLSCHPDGSGISRDQHDAFPIDVGTVHETADCSQCHTTGDYSKFSCVECHEHSQGVMDPAHSTVLDYSFDSNSCYACHPDGTATTREEHTYFPISTGSTHASADCSQCHTTGSYDTYSCIDCHEHAKDVTDATHKGVSGYVYDSPSCVSCHPDGTGMGRDEHTYFPITSGTPHEEALCNQCHTGSTYEEYSCLGCHEHAQSTMDSVHVSVSAYVYASASCLGCHPDGTAVDRDEHDYFPISSGAVHENAACEQCHTGASYAEFSCIDCHEHAQDVTDSAHTNVTNYVYASDNCLGCHPDGIATSRDEHLYFPITAGSTHADATCEQCHTTGTYADFSCIDCHEHAQGVTDAAHAGVTNYVYASQNCFGCHPNGTATSRDDHVNFPIQTGTPHQEAACNQCHTGSTYDQYSCLGCHEHAQTTMDSVHVSVSTYVYASPNCLGCHPDGTAVGREDHTYFPISTGAVHEGAACEECHTGATYAEFSCISCHEHAKAKTDDDHSEVNGYAYDSNECLACHPDGRATSRAEHNAFPIVVNTPHSDAACNQCHTGSSFDDFSCVDCHEHAKSTMDKTHNGVQDYVFASQSCYSCHPSGTGEGRDEHLSFPIATGAVHSEAGCVQCHTTGSYQAFDCTQCHEHAQQTMDPAHVGVTGYQFNSNSCLSCHPDGTAVTRDEHSYFPVDTNSTHENILCNQCHTGSTFDQFTCVSCHEHEQAAMDPSHVGVTGYKFNSANCLSCHPDGTALTRDEHTYFPVNTGDVHATAACNQCHTTASYKDFSCVNCHEHLQQTMDPAHAGVLGYQFDSASCISCHPDGTALTREEHDFFPVDPTSAHKDTACSGCHTTSNYSEYTCISCHDHDKATMDPTHSAVPGYAYASGNCLSCHPAGTATGETEHSYFPISSGSVHQDAQCSQCHTTSSFDQFTCLSCHEHEKTSTDTEHVGVTGYVYNSSSCLSCHPNGTALHREDHVYFPIEPSTPHQDVNCNECHTGSSYSTFSCVDCHTHEKTATDTIHAGVSGYVYASNNCLSCHPDGTGVSKEQHTYFPINTGSTHATAACSQCHTGTTYEQFSCVGCHEHDKATMDPAHTSVAGYIFASSSCISCHPDGTATTRDEHIYFPIDTGSTHASAACSQCHTTGSYDEFTCLSCHEHEKTATDADHATVTGYSYDSNACITCHPDGTAMGRGEHSYFPIDTGTAHEGADCIQCHTGSSFDQFSCIGCHEHNKTYSDAGHSNVSGYVYASPNCLACHPDGVSVTRDEHTFFPITSGTAHEAATCDECHTTNGDYLSFSCINCHTHNKTDTDANHATVSSYVYDSNNCLTCHPDGQAMSRNNHIYFPINTGTNHEAQTCEECHTTPGQYQIFTCTACHTHEKTVTDTNHVGVSGYVYNSTNCYSCHPEGVAVNRGDHNYFPISTGSTHSDIQCAECHTTSDYAQFSCVSCHEHERTSTNAQHADVLGYVYASSSCLSCHPDGISVSRDEHLYFPINSTSRHASVDCSECHTTGDYQTYACTSCHEHEQATADTQHTGVTGYLYASVNCYACHPDGLALSPEEHQPYFPIKTGTNHEGSACDACHSTGTYKEFNCLNCHEHIKTTADTQHSAVWGYVYASNNCYGCHPYGDAITEGEHSTLYFPITSGAHSNYKCQDCHKDASTYKVFTCTGCHTGEHLCSNMDPKHSGVKNYQCLDSACYSCHPNGTH